MSARHKARKRALDFLFEADLRSSDPTQIFTDRELPVIAEAEYAKAVVEGVQSHKAKIDELIISYAEGWDLDRMPVVDRNILRVAIFELLWSSQVPEDVAISEALLLSDENSTEDSTKYINGVLSRIRSLKSSLNIN
ncbi:MAG: transcription antitermination factor NusB [Actinomycetota bacterium]